MSRYDRHRPLFSDQAWQRLLTTPALIAGVGGLGTNVAMQLSRLAAMRIELWDPGVVDAPDLNRQILYGKDDIGAAKVECARRRLEEVNPELTVGTVCEAIDFERFREYSSVSDTAFVVFDCLDSFAARAGLSDIQNRLSCPIFHAGVESWYGQVTTLLPDGGGYKRAFGADYGASSQPRKPILPHVVSTAAGYQVGEFLRWCESPGATPLSDALLYFDAREMRVRRVEL
ncbi:MAG: ThiF family adenylyltransferase [Spirochaetota bacterium]